MAERSAKNAVSIPRPQIHTGPEHQTVDEATIAYLREAAKRVRRHRYWGSGVSHLVSTVLDDTADAMSTPPALVNSWHCTDCGHCHTVNGCIGDPTSSDLWAGVSPAACDCDATYSPGKPTATGGSND